MLTKKEYRNIKLKRILLFLIFTLILTITISIDIIKLIFINESKTLIKNMIIFNNIEQYNYTIYLLIILFFLIIKITILILIYKIIKNKIEEKIK